MGNPYYALYGLREIWKIDKQEESYKKKRRNNAKTNYTAMKRFFNENDWMKIKELKDIHEKYVIFLMIYEQRVKEYIPFYKVKEKGKTDQ